MRARSLVLAVLLGGCGASPTAMHSGAAAPDQTAQQPAPPATAPDQAAPSPSAEDGTTGFHSKLVANTASLPACSGVAGAEGWIVYVMAEKALKACVGGEWKTVDLGGTPAAAAEHEPAAADSAGGDTVPVANVAEPSENDVSRVGVESNSCFGDKCIVSITASLLDGGEYPPDGFDFVVSIVDSATVPAQCDAASLASETARHYWEDLKPSTAYSLRACLYDRKSKLYSPGATLQFTTTDS